MKIVKADSKGRVTGFEPGVEYKLSNQGRKVVADEVQTPKRDGARIQVDYSRLSDAPTRITLDVYDTPQGIAEEVERLWRRYERPELEVKSRGLGALVSDRLQQLRVKHTRITH